MSGVKSNPWHVTSLQDFQYFLCPECDSRHKDAQTFIDHALLSHEEAKETFVNLQLIPKPEEVKTEIQDDLMEVDIKHENENYEKFEETQDYEYEEYEDGQDYGLEEAEDDDYEDPDYDDGKVDDIEDFEEDTEESKQVKPKAKRMTRDPVTNEVFCPICETRWKGMREYITHLHEVHGDGEGRVKCDHCDKRFDKGYQLKCHIDREHKNQTYNCDKCGRECKSELDLKQHLRNIHHDYVIPPHKQIKKCDKCDRKYKKAKDFDDHQRFAHNYDNAFQCKECDTFWVSHLSLELHFIEEHKKLMYCCNYCGYASNTTNIIRRHVSHVHEGKREHVCHICSLEFRHSRSLIAHITRVHNPNYANVEEIQDIDIKPELELESVGVPIKKPQKRPPNKTSATRMTRDPYTNEVICGICETRWKGMHEYKVHLRQDHGDGEGMVKCDQCDKKFEKGYQLKCHIDRYHRDLTHTCDKCGKTCKSELDLKQHLRKIHHVYNISESKQVKKCDGCDTEFRVAKEFDEHLASVHKRDKAFKCKECDTKWVSHLSLELHLVETHKMLMWGCDICGYYVNASASLVRHKNGVHEKKKDFVCHICAQEFRRKNLLAVHLAKVHDIGEAKYKCDICFKVFTNNCYLKDHKQSVHIKDILYRCDHCEHSTHSKRALLKHIKKRHALALKCNQCDMKFNFQKDLTLHVITKHN